MVSPSMVRKQSVCTSPFNLVPMLQLLSLFTFFNTITPFSTSPGHQSQMRLADVLLYARAMISMHIPEFRDVVDSGKDASVQVCGGSLLQTFLITRSRAANRSLHSSPPDITLQLSDFGVERVQFLVDLVEFLRFLNLRSLEACVKLKRGWAGRNQRWACRRVLVRPRRSMSRRRRR